jgi:plastocyanin domain-containing protein
VRASLICMSKKIVCALLLLGCSKNDVNASGNVAVVADDEGFHPSSATVKKGVPLTLVFTRKSDKTCATEVVFPDLKIEKKLPLNEAVSVSIPTDEARTLSFQCGMGMYKSKVVVQ